jgi:hypothetical protein
MKNVRFLIIFLVGVAGERVFAAGKSEVISEHGAKQSTPKAEVKQPVHRSSEFDSLVIKESHGPSDNPVMQTQQFHGQPTAAAKE